MSLERKDALESVRNAVAEATDRGQHLYAVLLMESLRLAPDSDPAWGLYSTVLEAGERLLQEDVEKLAKLHANGEEKTRTSILLRESSGKGGKK